jgi:uncharacterized protein YndB with AHSA1/START domain/ketosteroid isomerase-like protein
VPDARAVLTRYLDFPPAEVFAWCTDAKFLSEWLGPEGFETCEVESDPRVGGRFAFRMTSEKGAYAAEGAFLEVTPPSRVSLTWRWTDGPAGDEPDGVESRLSFDLRPQGSGTLLTLTHEGLVDQSAADSHASGWSEALDKLASRVRTADVTTIVQTYLGAYATHDRAALEAVLAEDLHFTSPRDNRLNRATYFAHCWPNHEDTREMRIEHVVVDGETVMVTYEASTTRGRFRNTEVLTINDKRITDIQVYFGWTIPHPAGDGQFVAEDAKA